MVSGLAQSTSSVPRISWRPCAALLIEPGRLPERIFISTLTLAELMMGLATPSHALRGSRYRHLHLVANAVEIVDLG